MEITSRVDRLEANMADLAVAQTRTEAALARLADAIRELAAAQRQTETRLETLAQWQQGETGRRKGERFERDIIRSASVLFAGGYGAPPGDFALQQRMATLLAPLVQDTLALDLRAYDNVFAADLIWWKNDHVALAEISHVVEEHDVERATRRAAVLRRAGADVLPVVIGEFWADGEVRAAAVLSRMAWKVGNDVSERFIEFRRLPASPAPPSPPPGPPV